ncbi:MULTISPECIES: hypothetical protein [unclassified Sphingomonas]|uniref:hypothetical protein n=1 Tax=unclassified Sphingomonas TaxID=196159 RepID=UPI000AE6CAC2|nr:MULTISPECIES: hypothetical protein [unclassified Sphingomonas]
MQRGINQAQDMVPAAIDLSQRYGELDLPIIVMAGEGYLVAHLAPHTERFARELREVELRKVPAQGHLFHYACRHR